MHFSKDLEFSKLKGLYEDEILGLKTKIASLEGKVSRKKEKIKLLKEERGKFKNQSNHFEEEMKRLSRKKNNESFSSIVTSPNSSILLGSTNNAKDIEIYQQRLLDKEKEISDMRQEYLETIKRAKEENKRLSSELNQSNESLLNKDKDLLELKKVKAEIELKLAEAEKKLEFKDREIKRRDEEIQTRETMIYSSKLLVEENEKIKEMRETEVARLKNDITRFENMRLEFDALFPKVVEVIIEAKVKKNKKIKDQYLYDLLRTGDEDLANAIRNTFDALGVSIINKQLIISFSVLFVVIESRSIFAHHFVYSNSASHAVSCFYSPSKAS
eukprot:TRINITY_DN5309_c0_g1_i2.p1 TRINITY_DN5309_c0_g1~~TRINITY_DN5309_c0_g1_i2.p1  ORF type:complete len:329 (+),score=105.39 TRINITY_DN5309_c0_g1_i2:854-1840(+)